MLSTPVIYIFFNRPDAVRRTFPVIRAQRPKRLYLIADGPRATRDTDAHRCRETRSSVESMIDWDCDVIRDYSETNLGCGTRLATGLTRGFAELGEAIVLEDDILPHPDFFPFCAKQLDQFRDDSRIHSVGGFNPLGVYSSTNASAVPTMFNSIWGWASWQRSWKDYRFTMAEWLEPATRSRLQATCRDDLIFQQYAHGFDRTARGELDSWDYQWTYAMLNTGRHAVASTHNFIENIGFSPDATHTHAPEPWLNGLRTYAAGKSGGPASAAAPDRMHDRLYSTVMMSGSRLKIAAARAAARYPWIRGVLAR